MQSTSLVKTNPTFYTTWEVSDEVLSNSLAEAAAATKDLFDRASRASLVPARVTAAIGLSAGLLAATASPLVTPAVRLAVRISAFLLASAAYISGLATYTAAQTRETLLNRTEDLLEVAELINDSAEARDFFESFCESSEEFTAAHDQEVRCRVDHLASALYQLVSNTLAAKAGDSCLDRRRLRVSKRVFESLSKWPRVKSGLLVKEVA